MPDHGTVRNDGERDVYTLTIETVDEDAARATVERLVELAADWEERSRTDWSDVDEIVAKAADALNVTAAVAEYCDLHDDAEADVMEVLKHPLVEGTPAFVCGILIHAQYGNGRDANLSDISEAVAQARRLSADVPSPLGRG